MLRSTGVRSPAIPRPNVLSWREWIIIRSSEDRCEINRARNRGYRVAVSSERKRETNTKVGKDRDGDYLKLRRPDDVAILYLSPVTFHRRRRFSVYARTGPRRVTLLTHRLVSSALAHITDRRPCWRARVHDLLPCSYVHVYDVARLCTDT